MKTASNIYVIGGGKGGVGKSMVSIAFVDHLRNNKANNEVTLIESDDSNPDVYKAYESTDDIKKKIINIDAQKGWITLMDEMPVWSQSGEQVVINTAARSTKSLQQNLPDLLAGAKQLSIAVKLLWVINDQRDSLNLLHGLLNTVEIDTIVVKNLHFGEPQSFDLFDNSKLKERVKSIEFPELNQAVTKKIYVNRLPLHATTEYSFGEQMALHRFRNDVASQIAMIK